MKKQDWIIGSCDSGGEGVFTQMVRGTKQEVKRYMMQMILEDRMEEVDTFDFGTGCASDMEERHGDAVYGLNCFSDHHIDYEARPANQPIVLASVLEAENKLVWFNQDFLDEARSIAHKVYVDILQDGTYQGYEDRAVGCRVRIYMTDWEYDTPYTLYNNDELAEFLVKQQSFLKGES